MIPPTPEDAMIDRLVAAHENGEHEDAIYACPKCQENACEGCGTELAEFETTDSCRNCAR